MRRLFSLAVLASVLLAPTRLLSTTITDVTETGITWCADGVTTENYCRLYVNETPKPDIPSAQWTPQTPTPGQTGPCYHAVPTFAPERLGPYTRIGRVREEGNERLVV